MNVGDFSTVFAAQTAAVRTRRADDGRFEAEISARRNEKRERDGAELNALAPIAESRKVADETKRNATGGNVEKTDRKREKSDDSRGLRRCERRDFGDLGKRIDVFC